MHNRINVFHRFARPTAVVLALLVSLFVSVTSSAAQPRKFLTFSSSLSDEWIELHGKEYVYVWGESDGTTAGSRHAQAWRRASPGTQLSSYFPYGRDPARLDPSHWLASHPDWILYRCDETSMATLFGKPIVPLDIANPEVVNWQIENFLQAAHDDIAMDNFATANVERACGIWRDGQFVRLYPDDPRGVREFAEAKLRWLEQVSQALHQRKKTLTLNYQLDLPLDSPQLMRIVDAVDAVLDEEVYPARNPKRHLALTRFAVLMQQRGRALFTIYQLPELSRENVQSAMAAYLISAGPVSAVDITGIQEYGGDRTWFGYDRSIGDPCGAYRNKEGFFVRAYTGGLAVLRDPEAEAATYYPESGLADVDDLPAQPSYRLKPSEGLVLYRGTPASCENPANRPPFAEAAAR
jgi:hypothetical protein